MKAEQVKKNLENIVTAEPAQGVSKAQMQGILKDTVNYTVGTLEETVMENRDLAAVLLDT